jgi:hypothetical protein
MNYPSDWPCKLCNKRFDQHHPYFDGSSAWCFWLKENIDKIQVNWVFTPIDNLTLVERIANVRTTNM